jgi:quercetin dioxygenase-like cupin family protein
MPHEFDGHVHWHEPAGLSPAGLSRFRRPATRYDRFMEEEGIGVVRGMQVPSLTGLELSPWPRTGGRGRYLQLNGTEGVLGAYVVEVPAAGALAAERHLFEEVFLVLEGRGTTEIWRDGGRRHVFEWQRGAMFSIPLNANHRIVNATTEPARLLAGTTAPGVLNLLGDPRAVFASGYAPEDEDDDLFTPYDDIAPDPVRELALCRTRVVPDALGCDLPLDNRFSPGYRQMELEMTGTVFHAAIGQHRPGRYAKAHLLPPGAALICLGGTGYSLLWPDHLGPTPWRDGLADSVLRVEHGLFGMMAAGPGGGRWYHQSFGTSAAPLRHVLLSGTAAPGREPGPPGEEVTDATAIDLPDGGNAIPYWLEDPVHRVRHTADMLAHGIVNRMRDDDYRPPGADPL